MKYLYWLLGLVVVGGVGYVAYQYGAGNLNVPVPATNNTVTNNTANATTDIGAKTLTITSPKNGEIVVADVPFSVSGTVSANATKVVVTAYGTDYPTCVECTDQPQEKKIDEYTLSKFKLGDTTWSYAVAHQYGNAPEITMLDGRYVATATYADGTTKSATVKVTYNYTTAELGKPVIYLYPTKTEAVSVNVKPTGGISYSEPAIGSGWQVTASPDGTLVDATGKTWPYLFWEGFATNFVTPKEGFVVAASEVSAFFDEKLAALGMNAKEIADFKEFWVPRLQGKPYYFITFVPQATFDAYAPLTVNPKPDTVIRVFFDYKGLDALVSVPTQILPPTPARDGFTVVEWGGRLY